MGLTGYVTYMREQVAIIRNVEDTGVLLARALADRCVDPLLKNDFPQVAKFIAGVAESKGRGIAYAMAFDETGLCLAHSAVPMEGKQLDDKITATLVSDTVRNTVNTVTAADGKRILDIGHIMKVSSTLKGGVRIGFDLSLMEELLTKTVYQVLLMTAVAIGLGSIFALFLGNYILRPVNELSRGAQVLSDGDFEHAIPITSYDELGLLAVTFNSMKDNLRISMVEQKKKVRQFSALHSLGTVIQSFRDLDNLLKAIVTNAAEVMNSAKCSITLFDDQKKELFIKVGLGLKENQAQSGTGSVDDDVNGDGQGVSGDGQDEGILEHITPSGGGFINEWVIKQGQPLLVKDIETDKRFSHLSGRGYSSRSFMVVPLKLKDEVTGTMSMTEKAGEDSYTQEDLRLLTILASQVAMAIENTRFHEESIERDRIRRELEIANHIQMNMLPSSFPSVEGLDISSQSLPAKKVGGDYYDLIKISPQQVGVAIGDVSGKGMPAALLMVEIRTIIQAKAPDSTTSLEVIRKVNEIISKDAEPGMYATLFYGIYDLPTRVLTYTNAGHNYPLLYHPETDTYDSLETTGMFVGMFDNPPYKEVSVQLNPGDIIIFYTDGVTEAVSASGEMYGLKRLCSTISGCREGNAAQLREAIEASVDEFASGEEQADDITVMIMKVSKDSPA